MKNDHMTYLQGFDHPAMPAEFPRMADVFRQYDVLTDLKPAKTYRGYQYGFQGGCTDGEYIYTLALWKNDMNAILQKRDMYSLEVIAETTAYNFSHAGGITYCEKDGLLYISHAGGDNTMISRVRPETLELVDKIRCVSNIMNIAYCPDNDLFVCCIANPYYYGVYKLVQDDYETFLGLVYHIKPENPPRGYGKQSVCCDKDFIFATYSDCIHVFTWTGEHVRRYEVPDVYTYTGDRFEMEWAFIHGGMWYLGVYHGYQMAERYSCIWTVASDFYDSPDVQNLQGSTGIDRLNRLPAGTMVKLWGYQEHNGVNMIDLNQFIPYNAGHFKYLKVRYVGHNVGCIDWFKSGKLTIREFNLSDDVDSHLKHFAEMQLVESTARTGALLVESNIVHEEVIHGGEDGHCTIFKATVESGTLNTPNYLRITEVYGVV